MKKEDRSLERAIEAGVDRDYELARRILEELVATGAGGAEAILYLGRARHALGDYEGALLAFSDYLAIRPSSQAGRVFAGRSLLALGRPRRAERLFRAVLQHRPDDPTILGLLGLACLKGKRPAEAAEVLERAVLVAPTDQRLYRAYLNALLVRGIRLARSSQGPEESNLAASMLSFVSENGLDSVLLRLTLGRLEMGRGRHQEALDNYDRALGMAPGDADIRWYRASALLSLGMNREAAEELERLRQGGSDVPNLPWTENLIELHLARYYTESGEAARGAAACKSYLTRWGSEPTIHGMFAENLRALGRLEVAENHARRAIALAKEAPELRYALLLTLYEEGNWQELDRELRKAARLGCDEGTLLRLRALMAAKAHDDPRSAVTLAQEAIRSTGPAPALLEALALSYHRAGLPDLAIGWFRKAMAFGETPALWRALADAAAATGDDQTLREALSAYVGARPEDSGARKELVKLLTDLEDWEGVNQQAEALLAMDGTNSKLRRLSAHAYRKRGRYREAAILLRGLLRETPEDLDLLLALALCLERLGARGKAAELLLLALGKMGKRRSGASSGTSQIEELYLAAGVMLFKEKKTEKALECFREAVSVAPKDPRAYRNMERAYTALGSSEQAMRYRAEADRLENQIRNKRH